MAGIEKMAEREKMAGIKKWREQKWRDQKYGGKETTGDK